MKTLDEGTEHRATETKGDKGRGGNAAQQMNKY